MKEIYYYTGLVVVWAIIIVAIFSLLLITFWFGWFLFKRYQLIWEKISYYFGATIKTEILRAAYKVSIPKNTKKLAHKYRLRNIKNVSK